MTMVSGVITNKKSTTTLISMRMTRRNIRAATRTTIPITVTGTQK